MRENGILISGAAGEIGHALIDNLHARGGEQILTLDLKPMEGPLAEKVARVYVGSILDRKLLDTILAEYKVTTVIHLAALLSTRSDDAPAHALILDIDAADNAPVELRLRRGTRELRGEVRIGVLRIEGIRHQGDRGVRAPRPHLTGGGLLLGRRRGQRGGGREILRLDAATDRGDSGRRRG